MIFIGGIHGVGKSFLSKKIAEAYDVRHFSASGLIEEEKKEQFSEDKRTQYIGKNQEYLITALNRMTRHNEQYILDGHFCLLNKESQITRLPESTFESLSPLGIIVIVDSVEQIISRLKTRDCLVYNEPLIDAFQKEEIEYSEQIALQLGVPLLLYNNSFDTPKSYDNFLKILWNN